MKYASALILVMVLATVWLYRDGAVETGMHAGAPGPARIVPAPGKDLARYKHYLFDVTDHSPEEISAMLLRAERLNLEGVRHEQQVDIAMVLHGPDIEIFAKHNYDRYQNIVDTARRLEQVGVIDFKVCQRVMSARGITAMELPDFLEAVPYAADEIKRLRAQGYVTL